MTPTTVPAMRWTRRSAGTDGAVRGATSKALRDQMALQDGQRARPAGSTRKQAGQRRQSRTPYHSDTSRWPITPEVRSGPRRAEAVGFSSNFHRSSASAAERRPLNPALAPVGVNTDGSVERLKGPGRPVVPQGDRALVLAGLESVTAVTLFHEDTPRELLTELLPDVLVKGGDYEPDDIVGKAEVEDAGGRIEVIPFIDGKSTTELITRIRGRG